MEWGKEEEGGLGALHEETGLRGLSLNSLRPSSRSFIYITFVMSIREDISIPSQGEKLAAWLYPAARSKSLSPSQRGPAIVLAHGLGAVKEMRLDAYSERFSAEGYTCVAFDYRCSGESTGKPRGLVDVEKQLEDWKVVIDYVRKIPYVDPTQIGIFGSSFGGGNVIRVAARDPTIKAAISQCPFTSGFHSSLTVGLTVLPKLAFMGMRDILFGTDEEPYNVPLVGHPGEVALMNSPGSREGCEALIPEGYNHPEVIPARFALKIPFMRPGSYASQVQIPILFAICAQDTVAPPKPTLAFAKQAPKSTIKWYDEMGHFDIYLGEAYNKATTDYVAFLKEYLPIDVKASKL